MKQQFAGGVIAVLVAVVLWGAQFPIAKDAFGAVDPLHVTAVRYGVGASVLVLILIWREGVAAFSYAGRFWPAAMVGTIGTCFSALLVFFGLSLTRPEHAAVIVALQPSITAIADWLVRGRRPADFTLGCIVFAFAGVVMVVTKGQFSFDFRQGEWKGDVLVLLGATCWVAYTMATENFRGWSALRFTTLTLLPGTLAVFLVTLVAVAAGAAVVPGIAALTSVGWQLAYLALAGVVLALVCWNAGNQRIGALNAMLMQNFLPVVTFAVLFLQGQRYDAAELGGVGMVIGALVTNNAYLRRRAARGARRA